jgi:hypothetical protein
MTLKGGKKERQDRPIRMLQEEPSKILLSAHLISIKIEQSPGEHGYKAPIIITWAPSWESPTLGSTLPVHSFLSQ